ncbi:hypothetical protein AEAC466_21125 [Asticcacaulis sp. AC466]|uniref:hypothetical protein n=1 Tax=Asticcacaulis sp. AC466 TaxID=1282362 RepID=UPI0003C40C41|nr:hypothetical protein [Asticcacaulis sp. AC466]ESQ81583.1 hypothetical protein AEAC466_21125 [Asticcacaulis sp. AC466]
MKIAYFVHDLSDAAVLRRITLFKWGSAQVKALGFYRSETPPSNSLDCEVVPLARTYNAKLLSRVFTTLRFCLNRTALFAQVRDAEVMVARNLEMLLLAFWVRELFSTKPPLVYECLDIHRKMLGQGLVSRSLRALERFLLKKTNAVIVSSPAFRDIYFVGMQQYEGQVRLLENKCLETVGEPRVSMQSNDQPPWTIGWFGVLRCGKSLEILMDLARRMPGIGVLIAGKPDLGQVGDVGARIADIPNMRFTGPYAPSDFPKLYDQVHFTWAIDYFEEGLNSSWLLPNRLYEGGICGSVPIALASVETGAWLKSRHAGVLLDDPATELPTFIESLTSETYRELHQASMSIPYADLAFTHAEARAIVRELRL